MNEREFITKIESLKKIKPKASWVSLTRDEILGERKLSFVDFIRSFFNNKAFAATTALVFLGGIFFYSHSVILSDQGEEIAKEEKIQELSVVFTELKSEKVEMTHTFAELAENRPEEEVANIIKNTIPLLSEIDEVEERIVKTAETLGVKIEEEDESCGITSWLIADFEKRSLTEEDELLFNEAKEAYEAGNYREAREKILQIGIREEII